MSRKIGLVLGTAAVVCLFGVALMRSAAAPDPSRAAVAEAVAPAASPEASIPASNSPAPQLPQGVVLHEARKGESLPSLVRQYLPKTEYMTGSELERAIRGANPELGSIWFKAGQKIMVPGMLPEGFGEQSKRIARDFEVRAIYLTGTMAGSAKGLEIMRRWRELGGNAVVFDLKDSDGIVNVPFEHPLSSVPAKTPIIRNLPKLVRHIHSLNMVAIGRIAIFRDEYLATKHPELAIQSRRNGTAWRENGKLVWTDPSRKDIQDYNIALAKYGAQHGLDEIQFDYVRFPAEGDQKDAKFVYQATNPEWHRKDVITAFVARAHEQIRPMNVLFSLDVFGVVAWQRPIDLAHTGQDIPELARHCDVLSPMIYPSHFFGMDGYAVPGDAPEHFIGASMDRFRKITEGSGVVLRPWLQAFGWKTPSYSPQYIKRQVEVAKSRGGIGFLFWNARNDYSKPYAAMPEMQAGSKYVRGDELGEPVPQTTAVSAKPATSRGTM